MKIRKLLIENLRGLSQVEFELDKAKLHDAIGS